MGYAWILHLNDLAARDMGADATYAHLVELQQHANAYDTSWVTYGPWGTVGEFHSTRTELGVWTASEVVMPADDPGNNPAWTVPDRLVADTDLPSMPGFVTFKELPAAGDTFSAWTLSDSFGDDAGEDVLALLRSYLDVGGSAVSASIGSMSDAFKFAGQASNAAAPQSALWHGNVLVCAETTPANQSWSLSDLGGWEGTDLVLFRCGHGNDGGERWAGSSLPDEGAWVYAPAGEWRTGRRRCRTSRFLAGPNVTRVEVGGAVVRAHGVTVSEIRAAERAIEDHLAVAAIGTLDLDPGRLAGLMAPHLPTTPGTLIEIAKDR